MAETVRRVVYIEDELEMHGVARPVDATLGEDDGVELLGVVDLALEPVLERVGQLIVLELGDTEIVLGGGNQEDPVGEPGTGCDPLAGELGDAVPASGSAADLGTAVIEQLDRDPGHR